MIEILFGAVFLVVKGQLYEYFKIEASSFLSVHATKFSFHVLKTPHSCKFEM
jgi:hypothetical protein